MYQDYKTNSQSHMHLRLPYVLLMTLFFFFFNTLQGWRAMLSAAFASSVLCSLLVCLFLSLSLSYLPLPLSPLPRPSRHFFLPISFHKKRMMLI